jgi:hypothetical protein
MAKDQIAHLRVGWGGVVVGWVVVGWVVGVSKHGTLWGYPGITLLKFGLVNNLSEKFQNTG